MPHGRFVMTKLYPEAMEATEYASALAARGVRALIAASSKLVAAVSRRRLPQIHDSPIISGPGFVTHQACAVGATS